MKSRMLLVAALLIGGCPAPAMLPAGSAAPLAPSEPEMSIAEARLQLSQSMERCWRATGGGWVYGWSVTRNVKDQQPLRVEKLGAKTLEITDAGRYSGNGKDYGPYERRLKYELATLSPGFVEQTARVANDGPAARGVTVFVVVLAGETRNTTPFKWKDEADATRFVKALSRLTAAANAPPAPQGDADFAAKAEAWRALDPKPALPEDARKQRVLAENAFREKQREKAFGHFERALAIEPCWPEGNFNAALLAGELGFYEDAIRFMKRYLLLVPESRDAQAAKDKLIVWEDKLQSE